ncbi:hypothetical protein CTheo_8356 [Ceratobasidium theobromae]|uniref:Uncharacterized protein n=1 Tax=Ceratobasidium theobromae TaxID=1582974 RepID=A0A5N5Q9A2_9AGAM|nr:hypothetical protein CTheo_8356 [Ceratobasidium theobromae]
MDVPRRHVRRLSVPALTRFRRPNGIRRRRHAIATLKSLNIDEPPLHLAILSHLADLEARLNTSSYALQLLHQLRDEVVALFPTTDEYDFLFSLDLDFDLTGTYAIELSTLSLEEAKKKLSSLSYDDARLRFGALVEGVRQCISFPDLLARLAELRAALPADLSSATDRIVAFVEGLIEDDEDGDISWVDWHHKPKDKVDMHTLALQLSEGGKKLIEYCHLPEKWRNNEFVLGGYRFIPGSQWSTLVLSMFQMHNETVNIHTHFVPFLVLLLALVAPWYHFEFGFTPLPPSPADSLPKFLFPLASGVCLACSTIWHTLAGCSDLWLEGGARIDYVGIGWLINAGVSGVIHVLWVSSNPGYGDRS